MVRSLVCGYGRERDQMMGGEASWSIPSRREKLVKTAMDTWGRIDIIVNNADRDIVCKDEGEGLGFCELVHLKERRRGKALGPSCVSKVRRI